MEVINTSPLEYANVATPDYEENVHGFYDRFKIGIESTDRSRRCPLFCSWSGNVTEAYGINALADNAS